MICNQCRERGMKSTLNEGHKATTEAYNPGYYNEDGRYILPRSTNIIATTYNCSNGHQFTLRSNVCE
jgi:hypothetical protein